MWYEYNTGRVCLLGGMALYCMQSLMTSICTCYCMYQYVCLSVCLSVCMDEYPDFGNAALQPASMRITYAGH